MNPTDSKRVLLDIFYKYANPNGFQTFPKSPENSEIKPEFKAKGMEKAKEVLRYENMPNEEKYAYNRYVENRRIEMGVLDTAKDMGKRGHQIEVARKGLSKNLSFDLILDLSGLLPSEIQLLAEGKEIDIDDDIS